MLACGLLVCGFASAAALADDETDADPASSDCPYLDISFVRGNDDSNQVLGGIGDAFVDTLRGRLPGRSVDVYPVPYAAHLLDFMNVPQDVGDAGNALSEHIQNVADQCPGTKIVLGGYSLGAFVLNGVLSLHNEVLTFTNPLPAHYFPRINAVVVFGDVVTRIEKGPPPAIDPAIRSRMLYLCAPKDPICDDRGDITKDFPYAHVQYVPDGYADRAADFVLPFIRD